MKLLLCTVVASLTLLSCLSSAAVLPHPKFVKSIFEARRSNGVVPQGKEYDQFWELFNQGYVDMYSSYGVTFGQIKDLVNDAELFEQCQFQLYFFIDRVFNMFMGPLFRDSTKPMSQIALDFQELIAVATEDFTSMQKNINLLVSAKYPNLVPQLDGIFLETNAATTSIWTPTATYLKPFLPSQ